VTTPRATSANAKRTTSVEVPPEPSNLVVERAGLVFGFAERGLGVGRQGPLPGDLLGDAIGSGHDRFGQCGQLFEMLSVP
jgi:hypothetical protein